MAMIHFRNGRYAQAKGMLRVVRGEPERSNSMHAQHGLAVAVTHSRSEPSVGVEPPASFE